jgi:hypothetical protein
MVCIQAVGGPTAILEAGGRLVVLAPGESAALSPARHAA